MREFNSEQLVVHAVERERRNTFIKEELEHAIYWGTFDTVEDVLNTITSVLKSFSFIQHQSGFTFCARRGAEGLKDGHVIVRPVSYLRDVTAQEVLEGSVEDRATHVGSIRIAFPNIQLCEELLVHEDGEGVYSSYIPLYDVQNVLCEVGTKSKEKIERDIRMNIESTIVHFAQLPEPFSLRNEESLIAVLRVLTRGLRIFDRDLTYLKVITQPSEREDSGLRSILVLHYTTADQEYSGVVHFDLKKIQENLPSQQRR
jgi:hypothetical protein